MMSIPRIVSRNLPIFFLLLAAGFIPWIYRRTRGPLALAKARAASAPTADHFYARLLRLLARRGFHRNPEQTPVEFLDSLRGTDVSRIEEIAEITRVFCDSRYGEQPLERDEIERLSDLLARIEAPVENVR